MDFTARLNLPYLLPNQAQKHVTVNESLARLDAVVQLSATSTSLDTPPANPQDGDVYILPDTPLAGAWATATGGHIAVYQDAAWRFIAPSEGWACFDQATGAALRFQGGAWSVETGGDTQPQLGINTVADVVNRFAVKSDAELLSHDDITPGSGNARKVINKKQADAVASTLFQNNWTGHAEIGLIGDTDLTISVSGNGAVFQTAARFSTDTGTVTFPLGQIHSPSGQMMRSLLPTPGGDGDVSIYRMNVARSQNPRTLTLASISGDVLTLSTPDAAEVFEDSFMHGVSMVRIWNLSRTPIAPAWIKASGSTTTLQVSDAAQVAGWQNGDSLQVGDPVTEVPGRVIAIDVSPMMQARLGQVFPQAGMVAKLVSSPSGGVESGIELTGDGQPGSFIGTRGYAGQVSPPGQVLVPTMLPSPVSNSNLVFVRELDFGGGMGTAIVSINALFV